VDLAAFGFGTFLDGWIFFIKPFLNSFRTLLIRFLDRLLRGEAPAFEVIAYTTNRQFDAVFLLDQLQHGRTAPQGKCHLQLLRALVADQALDRSLLLRRQLTTIAKLLATRGWFKRDQSAFFIAINRAAHRRVAQPTQLDNLHYAIALTVQTDYLFAPLMLAFQ